MARFVDVLKFYVCNVGTRRLESFYLIEGRRRFSSRERILEVNVGGRQIKFSSGKFAKLAGGAIVAKLENTSVLVTAVSDGRMKDGTSWIPLKVDYRERASAAGKIPYNFFRRELRPMEREILTSRLIDRSIRPLFPEGYAYDTQIICSLLSVDGQHDQEVLSINGACAALMLSDIPWNGPIAAVRVIADSNGGFIVNPTKKQAMNSDLNIILVSKDDRIIMIEGYGNEMKEQQFCNAVQFGMIEAQALLEKLQTLKTKEARNVKLLKPSDELTVSVTEYCMDKIMNIFTDTTHKKLSRDKELFSLIDEVVTHLRGKDINIPFFMVEHAFWNTAKTCMESLILNQGLRCDGRGTNDLRPIECEIDLFELLHGSARFSRGETQVMTSVTLDSPEHAAKADEISLLIGAERCRNFMVHYDFPPFANNRTGHFMMTGRREVGHGALAEKALKPLLPIDFPFTVRVVSQVTDSNGSSSMATVCGSSLALFDAGVPMLKSVAGVACGLILDSESGSNDTTRYQILSDITGIEDALGCMDFKMAGTRDGITSCQIDIKNCTGLTYKMFEEAVFQSKESRLKVLDLMDVCQSAPRLSLKENGPAIEIINIPSFKRNKVVGMGGHKIRLLIEETGARIRTIDDEKMSIFAPSRTILNEVKERISKMMDELPPEEESLEVDSVYDARIVDIRSYGFIIELLPDNIRTLLHSSQISYAHMHPLKLGFNVGDMLKVKYLGRDEITSKLILSRKVLLDPSALSQEQDKENHMENDLEVGKVYNSVIYDIRSYGLMVKLKPNDTKILLHASRIDHRIVNPLTAGYKIDDEIEVKYLGRDETTGGMVISRKDLLEPSSAEPVNKLPVNELEVGKIYKSQIYDIRSYGLMVELKPSDKRMLLHRSEMDDDSVNPVTAGYKINDEIEVKYLGRDKTTGKMAISRKMLKPSSNLSDKTPVLKEGNIYNAGIIEIKLSGYIVELTRGGERTLLHFSEIDKGLVNPLQHGYKTGDNIAVKYLGRNEVTGELRISRRVLFAPPTIKNNAIKIVPPKEKSCQKKNPESDRRSFIEKPHPSDEEKEVVQPPDQSELVGGVWNRLYTAMKNILSKDEPSTPTEKTKPGKKAGNNN